MVELFSREYICGFDGMISISYGGFSSEFKKLSNSKKEEWNNFWAYLERRIFVLTSGEMHCAYTKSGDGEDIAWYIFRVDKNFNDCYTIQGPGYINLEFLNNSFIYFDGKYTFDGYPCSCEMQCKRYDLLYRQPNEVYFQLLRETGKDTIVENYYYDKLPKIITNNFNDPKDKSFLRRLEEDKKFDISKELERAGFVYGTRCELINNKLGEPKIATVFANRAWFECGRSISSSQLNQFNNFTEKRRPEDTHAELDLFGFINMLNQNVRRA